MCFISVQLCCVLIWVCLPTHPSLTSIAEPCSEQEHWTPWPVSPVSSSVLEFINSWCCLLNVTRNLNEDAPPRIIETGNRYTGNWLAAHLRLCLLLFSSRLHQRSSGSMHKDENCKDVKEKQQWGFK
jgi:hypothetical protein